MEKFRNHKTHGMLALRAGSGNRLSVCRLKSSVPVALHQFRLVIFLCGENCENGNECLKKFIKFFYSRATKFCLKFFTALSTVFNFFLLCFFPQAS